MTREEYAKHQMQMADTLLDMDTMAQKIAICFDCNLWILIKDDQELLNNPV